MPDDPPALPDPSELLPVTAEEIAEALAYALQFDNRGKSLKGSWGGILAPVVAEHLVRHLLRSRFVVMRKKPERPHSTG